MAGILDGRRALVFTGEDDLGVDIGRSLAGQGSQVWVAGPGGDGPFGGAPAEVADAFSQAISELGSVDTVVSASSRWWVGPPEEVSDSEWADLSDANGAAALAIIRETFHRIESAGSLTMLTHVWSMATSPEMGAVGASKAALGPLIKAAAYRGARRNMRVNGLAIGAIDSPFFRHLAADRAAAAGSDVESAFDRVTARSAMGRPGSGVEVGNVVAFLASDHARAITGVTVIADGGLLYA